MSKFLFRGVVAQPLIILTLSVFSFHTNAQIYTSEVEVNTNANGNLGVGTTSPASRVHVLGSNNTLSEIRLTNTNLNPYTDWRITPMYDGDRLAFRSVNAGGEAMTILSSGLVGIGTTSPGMHFEVQSSSTGWMSRIYNTNTGAGHGLLVRSDNSGTNHVLSAYSGGSYRFSVLGNGNVGIGTNTSDALLQVHNTDVHTAARYANVLTVSSTRTGSSNDNRLVGIALTFDFDDVHKSSQKAAGIFAQSKAAWSNNVDLLFYTRNSSTSPYYAERMRIKSNGNVGIGITSPSYKLDISGSARASAWYTTSDERSKENVARVSQVTDLTRVNGYRYQLKGDTTQRTHFGLLAQEVEEIYPEMVVTDSAGFKAVAYHEFIPLLIEQNNKQEKTIELLMQKMAVLEEKLKSK